MIRILGLASLMACAASILAASFAPSAFALSANAPQLCVGSPVAPPDCTVTGTCPTPPTNGTCGTDSGSFFPIGTLSSTDPNLCAAGGGSVSAFTGTGPWTWQCVGANGGSTAFCSAGLPKVAGVCGPAAGAGPTATAPSGAANLCSSGTAPSPATATQSGSSWIWICKGINNGANVSCSEPVQPTINGLCGTDNGKSYPAPPNPGALTGTDPNLCASGTLASFTFTGTGWTWNCNGGGLPPGSNASCSASVGINGVCGTVPGTCTAGTVSNVSDNGTTTTWTCNGTGTGTSASCSAPDQLNGACGAANGVSSATAPTTGLCNPGTASAVSSSGGNWVWTCDGFGGGTNASCSAPQTCVSTGCALASTIACGTAYVDNCGAACGTGTKCSTGTCNTGTGTCGGGSCTTGCTGSVCTIATGGTITLTGHISHQKAFNSTGATWSSPLPGMGLGSVFTGNAWAAHLGYFGMAEPFTCSGACGGGDPYCSPGTQPTYPCSLDFYSSTIGTSLVTETALFTLTNDGSNPGKNFLLGEQCNYLGEVRPGYYMILDPTYGGCADTWDVTTCTAANTIPPPTYYWHQTSYATPSTCPSTCQQTYTYECWCIGVGCAVNAPAASPDTACTSNGVPMPGPTSCYGGSCSTCWQVTMTPCVFSGGACNEDTASSTVSYATFCSASPMCSSTTGFSCDSPSETLCTADGYPSTDPNCGGTPINGVCGSDNGKTRSSTPTNLCSSGTPSSVSGTGPWTWTCYGSGTGATNQSCSANILSCTPTCPAASTLACGTTDTLDSCGGNTCSVVGTYCASGTCTGGTCLIPANGACGSVSGNFSSPPTTNLCNAGTASTVTSAPVPFPNAGVAGDPYDTPNGYDMYWQWTCNGSGGGTNATCSVKQTVNAACGPGNGRGFFDLLITPNPGFCFPGSISPGGPIGSSNGPWSWTCDGINGGTNTPVGGCTASKAGAGPGPENGICGLANGQTFASAPTTNLCAVGGGLVSPGGALGSATGPWTWVWVCYGLWGGTNASCGAN